MYQSNPRLLLSTYAQEFLEDCPLQKPENDSTQNAEIQCKSSQTYYKEKLPSHEHQKYENQEVGLLS